MSLCDLGFEIIPTNVPENTLAALRESLFRESQAGERCLLDDTLVQETAITLKAELIHAGHLGQHAVAIQAISFNKTESTNWKVAWHQDLMFPFFRQVTTAGYDLSCMKQGVAYARPPLPILTQLLAVRLHLDDCDDSNGPLRVSPKTHQAGIVETTEIPALIRLNGESTCFAKTGQALLMRPLTLHTSSKATAPKNRRVLHLVYHSGAPIQEPWHRTV